MKGTVLVAALIAVAQGLSAATFAVLPDLERVRNSEYVESYVFTTSSAELIAEIRNRIAKKESMEPQVRIAPDADGVNRDVLVDDQPAWNWHVVEVVSIDPFPESQNAAPKPWRDTPLREIDSDVAGFIAANGDVIAPRYLSRVVEINPDDPGSVINVSNRGILGTGDEVLICGLIVAGTTPRLVLVRALGPTLQDLGVPGAAADPALRLYRGQTLIAGNDNWEEQAKPELIKEALPADLLPGHPAEAALLVLLEPGAYTIHGSSAAGEGIGLLDAFDVSAMPRFDVIAF